MTICFLLFSSYYFSNISPQNPLFKKNFLQQLSPQGFGFYSKSPTEENISFHTKENLKLPNALPNNFFGIKREGRVQAIELGKIVENIDPKNWKTCENHNSCTNLEKQIKPIKVIKNEDYIHLSKGEYLIYRQKPLSWYWIDFKQTTSFERKVLKIKIV
ncbi:sporulation-delaying system protein SdpA [Bacillus subtilis]|uniref:sporulation-delaying system protein SdpA n=1 Tax=Bacillus subtilis TaxID=1423 RepID=UPI00143161FA|nr:sporulation-delaying system protein SdpA [Bacillus subtilis]NJI53074.1 sporulation-delaying system protein SdpA [Bacillus subtilis]